MPSIQPLSPHVADLIAAGEVVERPASVVKELVENAIDAGACSLTVEIQNGGMTLVRITDDGCGIPAAELKTAFLRHATSKLRTEHDLEAIGTLGFRGEALAAIAAVSRVEVLTRTAESPVGAALTLEGGTVLAESEAGCPRGTTMLVRDLFFNTPARLKFMKRDAAEGAAVFAIVQRLALSHPEVSVKFIRDGKQELFTPGDGVLQSAVYSVLGRDIALGLLPVTGDGDGLAVSGFISLPACCRGSRSYQHFFVNGRQVRSRLMMAALEEAYKNQKMVGKFPACVLQLTTKLSTVDVNVHPTKTEVKFAADQKIFDVIYYAALAALTGTTLRPAVDLPPAAPIRSSAAATLRDIAPALPRGASAAGAVLPADASPLSREKPSSQSSAFRPPAERSRADRLTAPRRESAQPHPAPRDIAPLIEPAPFRLIGEALQTYIIVEQGDALLLIDKHAAHERMEFDRLRASAAAPMPQRLLEPAAVTLPPAEGAVLMENLALLTEFGFEAEEFGGDTVLVRAAPADIGAGEVDGTLQALAARLLATGTADPAAARDELLHTIACKAAVKAGQKNDPAELMRIAEAVCSGRVKYCPHGRPVAIELTKAQLEKQVRRA